MFRGTPFGKGCFKVRSFANQATLKSLRLFLKGILLYNYYDIYVYLLCFIMMTDFTKCITQSIFCCFPHGIMNFLYYEYRFIFISFTIDANE